MKSKLSMKYLNKQKLWAGAFLAWMMVPSANAQIIIAKEADKSAVVEVSCQDCTAAELDAEILSASTTYLSYISFDLTDLPAGASIAEATLRVFDAELAISDQYVNVALMNVASDWDPEALTYLQAIESYGALDDNGLSAVDASKVLWLGRALMDNEDAPGTATAGSTIAMVSEAPYTDQNLVDKLNESLVSGDGQVTLIIYGDTADDNYIVDIDYGDGEAGPTLNITLADDSNPGLTTEYDFDDLTLQGWTQVMLSNTANGPTELGLINDTDPAVGNSTPPAPFSGSSFIGPVPFEAEDGTNTRDQAHQTLLLRSPEFNIHPNGQITFGLIGGAHGSFDIEEINSNGLPADSSGSGVIGVALRKASTGEYLAFHSRSEDGSSFWETVTIDSEELSGLVESGESYTLDFIDSHNGGWGWGGLDSVVINEGTPVLSYDFDDQTLQGWTQVMLSNTANGPTELGLINDTDPAVGNSTPPAPFSGSSFIGPVPFEAEDGTNTRDQAHQTLLLRSPEFNIHPNGQITFGLIGGAHGSFDIEEINSNGLPTDSSGSGVIGVALRKASTGEYLAFHSRSEDGSSFWETVTIDSEELSGLVESGESYTLDFIDSHNGGWGWGGLDSVVISSGSSSDGEPQTLPTFSLSEPTVLTPEEWITKEAALAINTTSPEVLFTTISSPFDFGSGADELIDPITGEASTEALVGYFYNPITMEPVGEPFVIVGNPDGGLQKHDVKYNPISNQYNVVVAADSRGSAGSRVLLVGIINPADVAGPENRIASAFVHEEDSDVSFQDTAVATSTRNGNFLIVAEYQLPDQGEAVVGMLFDSAGTLLSPPVTRLDQIVPEADEDDPDVVYLPENDAFLFLTNTDNEQNPNVITGAIIGANVDAEGNLVIGEQQILGQRRLAGTNQGHPSAIENPFTGEFIGAFDYDNGADGGDLFYFNIGSAPNYVLTEARPQIPYLESLDNNPYNHRHPQMALDFNSGVIALMTNPHGSVASEPLRNGIGFTLLGKDGTPLPGADLDGEFYHTFVPTFDPLDENSNPTISNDANYYNIKYDPFSDAFIGVWTDASAFTFAVKLAVANEEVEGPIVDFQLNGDYSSMTLYGNATLVGGYPGVSGDLPAFSDASATGEPDDQSLVFDGAGSSAAYWSDLNGWLNFDGQDYTIEAWVMPGLPSAAGNGNTKGIILAYGLPGGYSMWIADDGTLGGTTYEITDVSTDVVVPNDSWHHVALVHQVGVEIRFYLDGELAQTVSETRGVNPTTDMNLHVGYERSDAAPLNPFNGLVDRIRVTPEALEPDVFDLYAPSGEGVSLVAGLTQEGDVSISWDDRSDLVLEAAPDVLGPWYPVVLPASDRSPKLIDISAGPDVDLNGNDNPFTTGLILFRLREDMVNQ